MLVPSFYSSSAFLLVINNNNNKIVNSHGVLWAAARKQDHSEVERYRAGYLYRSTAAEKPTVTVISAVTP